MIKYVGRYRVLALVTAFAAAAGLSPASAGDETRRSAAAVVSARIADPQGAVGYWTRARMRAALPAMVDRPGSPAPAPLTRPIAGAEPRTVAPSQPQGAPVLTKTFQTKQFGDEIPFTSTEVTNTEDYPYQTHGKVFFTDAGGDWVCSGTVITSASESLVATAGHCVNDPGNGFASKWVFAPGYRNGNAPFGTWAATQLFTPSSWANNGNFAYDAGMAKVTTRSGQTIQDVVGSRGITFNQSAAQEFDAFGYPAGHPFNGSQLYRCDSDIGYRDGAGSVAPLAIGCDMTGGSSGGGWVIDDAYVNSVVSYGYRGLTDVLFGPYFGSTIESLYEDAGGEQGGSSSLTPPPDPSFGEPVDHELALTLRLRKHLKAKGKMTALDGYFACAQGTPVEIYRLIDPVTGVRVGRASTNDEGKYSVRIKDRRGGYFAYGPEGPANDLNFCLEAFSPGTARHRH